MSTQKVPLKLQNYLIAPSKPRECSQDLNSPLCCATYYHFKVKFLLVNIFNWYRPHTFWNAGKSEGKAWLATLKVVFQKIMKTLLIKVNFQKESGFKRYIFFDLNMPTTLYKTCIFLLYSVNWVNFQVHSIFDL